MVPKYTPVPNLAHVEYAYGTDKVSKQFWVFCKCNGCGELYKRPCSDPPRASRWVVYFGGLHRDC